MDCVIGAGVIKRLGGYRVCVWGIRDWVRGRGKVSIRVRVCVWGIRDWVRGQGKVSIRGIRVRVCVWGIRDWFRGWGKVSIRVRVCVWGIINGMGRGKRLG